MMVHWPLNMWIIHCILLLLLFLNSVLYLHMGIAIWGWMKLVLVQSTEVSPKLHCRCWNTEGFHCMVYSFRLRSREIKICHSSIITVQTRAGDLVCEVVQTESCEWQHSFGGLTVVCFGPDYGNNNLKLWTSSTSSLQAQSKWRDSACG